MGRLGDQTGSGKIQDGGLLTSSACISASRKDINEIQTAIPMFSGSSFPLGLMRILSDRTGNGKIQDGGLFETEMKIEPEWSRFDCCWVDEALVGEASWEDGSRVQEHDA